MQKDTYKTISNPSEEVLFKDKNSKFFGYAFPIKHENDVNDCNNHNGDNNDNDDNNENDDIDGNDDHTNNNDKNVRNDH